MSDTTCKYCGDTGSIPIPGSAPPIHEMCVCRLQAAILSNVERGLRGLTKQPKVPKSVLTDKVKSNVWITANQEWFLPHLRHVAIRQPPTWSFTVTTDADLMTAWLATAALKGSEILDADVMFEASEVGLRKMTIADASIPHDLLVVRLGVKAARNQAMPEVLLEAINNRLHQEGKATWIWDQPDAPLAEGHLAFSHAVRDVVKDFIRVSPNSSDAPAKKQGKTPAKVVHGGSVRNMFLTGDEGSK